MKRTIIVLMFERSHKKYVYKFNVTTLTGLGAINAKPWVHKILCVPFQLSQWPIWQNRYNCRLRFQRQTRSWYQPTGIIQLTVSTKLLAVKHSFIKTSMEDYFHFLRIIPNKDFIQIWYFNIWSLFLCIKH